MKFFILLILSLIAFQGCQNNPSNSLQEAQYCLNSATESTARSCVESIKSIDSPESYKLQCAAIFISEGYGSAMSLINSLKKIDSVDTTGCSDQKCSSTLLVMKEFNFSRGDNTIDAIKEQNLELANEAVSVCGSSDSKGYAQISSLFKLGTMAALPILASGQPLTVTNIEAQVNNLPSSDLGQLVLGTYNLACSIDSTSSNTNSTDKYCSELASSISQYGENTEKIGACLKTKLNDPNAVCAP